MHPLFHLIAVGQSLGKMIARVEKQNRDVRMLCNYQIHQRHALGLKAGGDARRIAMIGEYPANQGRGIIYFLVQRHGCPSCCYHRSLTVAARFLATRQLDQIPSPPVSDSLRSGISPSSQDAITKSAASESSFGRSQSADLPETSNTNKPASSNAASVSADA